MSKTYVYGYVSNAPYEKEIGNSLEGIAIEYINRVVRLTNIDIKYVKYKEEIFKVLKKFFILYILKFLNIKFNNEIEIIPARIIIIEIEIISFFDVKLLKIYLIKLNDINIKKQNNIKIFIPKSVGDLFLFFIFSFEFFIFTFQFKIYLNLFF